MSAFPSMISTEPPPIESDGEEEFEDEFRSNGLRLDISEDPSPFCSPRKGNNSLDTHSGIPVPSFVNEDSGSLETELSLKSNKTASSQTPIDEYLNIVNSQKQVIGPEAESIVVTSEESNVTFSIDTFPVEVNTHMNSDQSSFTLALSDSSKISNAIEIYPSETDHLETAENHFNLQNGVSKGVQDVAGKIASSADDLCDLDLLNDEPNGGDTYDCLGSTGRGSSVSFHALESVKAGVADDEFGDFDTPEMNRLTFIGSKTTESDSAASVADYKSCSKLHEQEHAPKVFEDFNNVECEDQDVGYGHFASNPLSESCVLVVPKSVEGSELSHQRTQQLPASVGEEEDDFGDFASSTAKESFSHPVVPAEEVPSSFTQKESMHLEGKFDAIVKSVFSSTSTCGISTDRTTLESIDKQLENPEANLTWTHVHEFEDSHCLLHKWPRSTVHQLLFRSLNIDSSNIIYSAKYGTIEVPKFASSLVDSPLQPQLTRSSQFDFPCLLPSTCESLDDDSPEYEQKTQQLKPEMSPSKEAKRILQQLPDLSYMLAKALVFPRKPKY